jgi:NarL family two-component system response regulator LiaR
VRLNLDGTLVVVTIRVVLADDHLVLRQGVRALLQYESDIELVGEADNGRDAVDVVLETGPDVALINLVMPEIDGVAATRIIHRESLKTRILILLSSEELDKTALIAAVRAGAIGVIRKSASIELVARSIRGAARGEAQFSPADASLLVEEVQEPERLTAREFEVLQMISDGLANKEIAWKLRISEKTVKKHVSTILDKFGLQSRTQAALHAWRVGLARPERLQVGAAPIASMDRARRLQVAPHVASPV